MKKPLILSLAFVSLLCLNFKDMHEDNKEIWKSILGIESYKFSSHGRILSLKGSIYKILSTTLQPDGYCRASLRVNNKYISKRVHQWIALAFIPNPHNLPQVNHKDCNKANNHVSNLEWCTCQYNIRHAFSNNLVPRLKGEQSKISGGNNHCSKIVINLETGIYYECISYAAFAHKIKRTTLNAMLTGRRINKTSLSYA